jgi:hypothetical protein
MAYTAIDDSGLFMNTVLYTGNGGTQSITGVGFQPDFTWIKQRDGAEAHFLFDAIRGTTERLITNTTGAEVTVSTSLTAFGSDGFTVGANNEVNQNTRTIVAWNWIGNGSGSANTVGDIASTVSVNTTSGFSIVTWTSTGSTGTVGHGLGVVPKFIVVKRRVDSGYDWVVYHVDKTAGLYLNTTGYNEDSSSANIFGRNPTATVFDITADGRIGGNTTGDTYVAYCFAEIAGYSKFGSYTGNGNADGPFIYTGFTPAYIMIKTTSGTDNWIIFDNKRPADSNSCHDYLKANAIAAEDTDDADLGLDFISGGFKLRGNNAAINTSGGSYIYMAFAEAPFVNSNGVPCNAR